VDRRGLVAAIQKNLARVLNICARARHIYLESELSIELSDSAALSPTRIFRGRSGAPLPM
jgi:hypothetical protein